MTDDSFDRILRQWIESRGFRRDADAADALGLDRSVLNKYKNGETAPSFDRLVALLERMGGSMARALPWYDASADVEAEIARRLDEARARARWPVVGDVSARTSAVTFHTRPSESLPEVTSLFERSPLWGLGAGTPAYLRHIIPGEESARERYRAHFAIRALDAPLRLREGPEGKIYAVARVVPAGEYLFGTWMRVYGADFLVYMPAARIVGELEVEKRAWGPRDVVFTHVVLGVVSYNTYDPEPVLGDGRTRRRKQKATIGTRRKVPTGRVR